MTILVTGASGYFAREFIFQMLQTDNAIIAVSSDVDKIKNVYYGKNVKCISNEELLEQKYSVPGNIDIIVHTAFCRKSDGEQLVNSLSFTKEVFMCALTYHVKGIINISSQSVYGHEEGERPDESVALKPAYMYALAKAASELLLNAVVESTNVGIGYTNVRLASLIGPSNGIPDNVLKKFIVQALQGKDINIVGGEQKFSFMDVRDAANAIIKLCNTDVRHWKNEYNLGNQYQVNIVDMANIVNECVVEIGKEPVAIHVTPQDIQLSSGMNCDRIMEELDWLPQYSFQDTVKACVEYEISRK